MVIVGSYVMEVKGFIGGRRLFDRSNLNPRVLQREREGRGMLWEWQRLSTRGETRRRGLIVLLYIEHPRILEFELDHWSNVMLHSELEIPV